MVIFPNLEVVHVANHEKQQDLLTLLHDIAEVTALGSIKGSDHYVVFECPDRRLKVAIEKMFAVGSANSAVDYGTVLPLQPGGGAA